MIHRFPKYYKDFTCIADKCRDNCCRGKWDIEIDEDTLDLYEAAPDDIREKLLAAVKVKDEVPVFKTCKGGCVWLDKDGLCGLYASYGEKYQSEICRQFPRLSEYFGGVKESGLGLACEEASRILFTCDDDALLAEEETEGEEYRSADFDESLARIIFRMRDILVNITLIPDTNNEGLVKTLYGICEKFQDMVDDFSDGEDGDKILSSLKDFEEEYSWEKINETMISPEYALERADAVFISFSELPDIRRGFDEVLESIGKRLEDESLRSNAGKIMEEFDLYIYKNGRYDDYKRFIRYILFRYFAKAVYDRDVLLKGKMLASFFTFLKLYDITRWLNNKKSFKLKDRISTAKIFSGEVEYSEDNMQQLFEDFLFDSDCF